jgi:DNA-directed RNA polymerase delta subunit
VITAFLEEEGAEIKYSLARFLAKGEKIWKIKPGQWYSMTQITTILQALHENYPIKGS